MCKFIIENYFYKYAEKLFVLIGNVKYILGNSNILVFLVKGCKHAF